MYVLTLKQPWASLVVFGPKDIENRSWCNEIVTRELIGKQRRLLIHAAASETRDYYAEATRQALDIDPSLVIPPQKEQPHGVLLGFCQVTGLLKPKQWEKSREKRLRGPTRWHFEGQYGWVLGPRTALPAPVPAKGSLQLWKLGASVFEDLGVT